LIRALRKPSGRAALVLDARFKRRPASCHRLGISALAVSAGNLSSPAQKFEMRIRSLFKFAAFLAFAIPGILSAQVDDATKLLAHDIFKQLIEINTTDSVGSSTLAAQAVAKRLLDAGFPASDVQVLGPNERKGNLVARLHGTGAHKPILFICHTDVVEARREDWSLDPFKFTEQDGYFYGRGTEDIKEGDAILVTTFIRLKHEAYQPDRDIILALTADEEGGASNGVDWLLKNHRGLIDAEFILNPDAGDFEMDREKRLIVGIQASEKLYADFQLEVHNKGGHSSLPEPDNAIYQLAEGLTRLARYTYPFELNEVTRAYFAREADIVGGAQGANMKAILRRNSRAIDQGPGGAGNQRRPRGYLRLGSASESAVALAP
jgi:acetylornithine deacetylase/succinyl-diaminopimelate desuccinylase-like protein